jgi:hypothetical protein
VGILAVVSFQTELIATSAQSKAKAEALQLAQERIEEFKNFSFDNVADFAASTTYATTTYAQTTDETINGSNATFTRDYKIDTTGDIKSIEVKVSWTDVKDGAMDVTLNTALTYESQVIISAENIVEPPMVTSATGDATIGAGTVKCGSGAGQTPCTDNGDGTSIAEDGGDLKLVIDNGDSSTDDKVVLTLEDACVSGTCTQFVQIRGSIYVDNSTQGSLDPDGVKVLSSDAGYCQRFYLKNGGAAISSSTPVVSNTASNTTTYYIDANSNGTYESGTDTTSLTAETDISTAPASASGDYDYFRYSCYLGGGWHGNIGILLSGGNTSSDHFCIGDPNSVYLIDQPSIAARRVYRGMTYKDVDGAPLDNSSVTREPYTLSDGSTDTRYYSEGVKDGAQLDGQDFVVASLSSADGDYCVSATAPATIPFTDNTGQPRGAMTRTDSTNGGLFAGVPADFVCFNKEGHLVGSDCIEGAASDRGLGETSCHLLIAPELPYGADYSCPYDPTSPPNAVYAISGTLTFTSANSVIGSTADGSTIDTTDLTNTVFEDPNNPGVFSNVNLAINTDQSLGNCSLSDWSDTSGSSPYTLTYNCNAYDWPDDGVTGWTGEILTSNDLTDYVICNDSLSFTAITSDQSSQNITCLEGGRIVLSGTVTNPTKLASVVSGGTWYTASSAATGTANGTCNYTSGDSSYSCRVDIPINSTWTGALQFTHSTGTKAVCYSGTEADSTATAVPNTRVYYTTAVSPGSYTAEAVEATNNSTCP